MRHRSRKPFLASQPCLITLKVVRGLPSLRKRRLVREIEAAFRAGNERADFRLVHDSIQRNHAHLLVEADDREALARGMTSLATRFALAINRVLGRTGRVLADRYHHRILTCPRQVRNALAYVLLNARRHAGRRRAANLVPAPRLAAVRPARSERDPGRARSLAGGLREPASRAIE